MSATLKEIHEEILSVTPKDQLVLGVNKNYLREIYTVRFSDYLHTKLPPIATSLKVLSVGVQLLASTLVITEVDYHGKFRITFDGTLEFLDPAIPADPRESHVYRKRPLIVKDLEFTLQADINESSGVRVVPTYGSGRIQVLPVVPKPRQELIKNNYNGDENQYLIEEGSVALLVDTLVSNAMVELLAFPNLKKGLRNIVLSGQLGLITKSADWIILHGVAKSQLTNCGYSPNIEGVDAKGDPLQSLPKNCGDVSSEVEATGKIKYLVVYPKIILNAIADDRVRIGIAAVDGNDVTATITYYTYNVTALLKDMEFELDEPNLTIKLAAEIGLSGSAAYGLVVPGCHSSRTRIFGGDIDYGSKISTTFFAKPCIDNSTVYLKVSWTSDPDVNISFDFIGGSIDPISIQVREILRRAIKAKLSTQVKEEIAGKTQIALFSVDGWGLSRGIYSDDQGDIGGKIRTERINGYQKSIKNDSMCMGFLTNNQGRD